MSVLSEQVAALAQAGHEGQPTRIEWRDGVAFLINAFWTARQRQGHRLHEVSYRACFKPQLPAFFIDRLTRPGDLVHDPFMGRGTTAIQSALMERRVAANDINPLSAMLVRPRLNTPDQASVLARLAEIDWQAGEAGPEDLLSFYHPDTLARLMALRTWFADREASGRFDTLDDWIRMVALNRLTGHSSGFFSVYTLPPNQAVSVKSQDRINERRGQVPPVRDVAAIIARKSRALLADGGLDAPAALICTGDSAHTSAIAEASVQLVVTSPPFLDIVQYAQDNWLRCWFAGIDAQAVPISMHRKPEDWIAFVRRTLVELARVVRPGGHVAFEVGEVRGGSLPLEILVLQAFQGLAFEVECVLLNVQDFSKTANCWGVGNNALGVNSNRIVLARRV